MLYVRDQDKYVYHYTSADTAIQFILENKNLRLSSFRNTNDPREFKDWDFVLSTYNGSDLDTFDEKDISSQLSSRLKDCTKLLCFSSDKYGLEGNYIKDLFLRGFCKPRMWAQYANLHKGVCLVFEKNKIIEEAKRQFSNLGTVVYGCVDYSDNLALPTFGAVNKKNDCFSVDVDSLSMLGMEDFSRQHFYDYHNQLFFEKMTDWSNESEWRLVVYSKDNGDKYLQYGSSLVGVFFGESISDEDIARVKKLTPGLKSHKLEWRNSSPFICFIDS
jgi:hypothetical protein